MNNEGFVDPFDEGDPVYDKNGYQIGYENTDYTPYQGERKEHWTEQGTFVDEDGVEHVIPGFPEETREKGEDEDNDLPF